jgi:Flp pilus assembly protein TadG
MRRVLTKLRADERGATLVEFAIVAPVFCLFLVGAFDISHELYMRSALQGIVQKAARDATIEGSVPSAIDKKVENQVRALANNATITYKRRFYKTFEDAAAAKREEWTDLNMNGKCDNNEPFVDINENNVWDEDGGNAGQGGAKDAAVYTVNIKYPRMLPLHGFLDVSPTVDLTATTILRNQPFDAQKQYDVPKVRNCA